MGMVSSVCGASWLDRWVIRYGWADVDLFKYTWNIFGLHEIVSMTAKIIQRLVVYTRINPGRKSVAR
jgi:hypothetical protein